MISTCQKSSGNVPKMAQVGRRLLKTKIDFWWYLFASFHRYVGVLCTFGVTKHVKYHFEHIVGGCIYVRHRNRELLTPGPDCSVYCMTQVYHMIIGMMV